MGTGFGNLYALGKNTSRLVNKLEKADHPRSAGFFGCSTIVNKVRKQVNYVRK